MPLLRFFSKRNEREFDDTPLSCCVKHRVGAHSAPTDVGSCDHGFMLKLPLTALSLAVAVAALSASVLQQQPMAWVLTVHPVASPAAANSGQPQLSVSDRGALLSWIERTENTATLKFAERTPAGWSAPVTVASGTNWFVNWSDVPSVLRLSDGTLVGQWLQKSGPGTYAYDVRLSFSKDDGKTWTSSITPHHDGTATEHGFASLFEMPAPQAGLGLAWLDGRAMAGGGHSGHGGGAMSLRFATYDQQGNQAVELPIDLRVCECCPTSAAVTAEGPIVAFRNRGADEIRDIHVSRFENGKWIESTSAHEDGWRIAACPVNGPMLSARGRSVALAWFTAKNDHPRAYAAFSRDAGRTFGTPIRLDDAASLGRVDIELLPDGSALASYVEYANGRASFSVRRIERSGRRSEATTISRIEDGRTSGYPRIALHGRELVFAWLEHAGSARVRTAVAALPR